MFILLRRKFRTTWSVAAAVTISVVGAICMVNFIMLLLGPTTRNIGDDLSSQERNLVSAQVESTARQRFLTNLSRSSANFSRYGAFGGPGLGDGGSGEYVGGGKTVGLNKVNSRRGGHKWEERWPVRAEKIVESMEFLNQHHEVLNEERYGRLGTTGERNEVDAVIVIQVHNRIDYLRYAVESLSRVRGIERALLVFSHDFISEPINHLVRNITFTRAIQILYPYNIQLFPNTFPGHGMEDCPERASRKDAEVLKCRNWQTPDSYGNYRVAAITQIKHHWWWKMNYVFDGIVRRYGLERAYVVLLEEDHMVAPDFLHVLKLMAEKRPVVCPDCQVLCLGTYLKSYKSYREDSDKLAVHFWFSSKHNMGMAINSATWELLKAGCSKMFCTYDDYNWDWSLMHMSVKCLPSKLRVVLIKAPRVLHIGDCGVHTHRGCAANKAATLATELFNEHLPSFFPAELHAAETSNRMLKPPKPNGGWGDPRDHELCLLNANPLEPLATHPLNNNRTDAARRLFNFEFNFQAQAVDDPMTSQQQLPI